MRRFILYILATLTLASCKKAEKTIEDTAQAANIAFNQASYFNTFAKIANKENKPQSEKLFSALAKSAQIQFEQLEIETKRLGNKEFTPSQIQTQTDSTLNNLYKTLASQQYEFYNLYPEFIENAQTEKKTKTTKILTKLANAKKQNIGYITTEILQITNPSTLDNLSQNWIVCNNCSAITNPQDIINQNSKCPLCNNKDIINTNN